MKLAHGRSADLLIPLFLGLVAVVLAAVASSSTGSALVTVAALFSIGGLTLLWQSRYFNPIVTFVLALAVPFNAQVTVFRAVAIDPKGHAGGAPAIQLHGAFIAICLLLFWNLGRRSKTEFGGGIGWRPDRLVGGTIIAYILVGALTLTTTTRVDYTLYELVRLLEMLLAFGVVASMERPEQLRPFLLGLAVGVILEAVVAAFQYSTGHTMGLKILGEDAVQVQDIGYSAKRSNGTIGNPNQFGYYLEILVPVIFAMLITTGSRWLKVLFFVALVAALAAMVTTLSRAAWGTVPLTIGFVAVTVLGIRMLYLRNLMLALPLIAAMLIAVIVALPLIEKRFTHDDQGSMAARTPLNEAALSVIGRNPILGVGLNNFAEVFQSEDQTGQARVFRTPVSGIYAKQVVHNMYLLVWGEMGIIGLVAFLMQFVAVFILVFRLRHEGDIQARALRLGVAAGFVAQLLHALVDPGFKTVYSVLLLVYCLMGVIVATSRMRRPSRSKPSRRSKDELMWANTVLVEPSQRSLTSG